MKTVGELEGRGTDPSRKAVRYPEPGLSGQSRLRETAAMAGMQRGGRGEVRGDFGGDGRGHTWCVLQVKVRGVDFILTTKGNE